MGFELFTFTLHVAIPFTHSGHVELHMLLQGNPIRPSNFWKDYTMHHCTVISQHPKMTFDLLSYLVDL